MSAQSYTALVQKAHVRNAGLIISLRHPPPPVEVGASQSRQVSNEKLFQSFPDRRF